jgi:hypothetical protein
VSSAAIIKPKKTYDLNLRKLDILKNLSRLSSLKKRAGIAGIAVIKKMGKGTVKKFGLKAIADALRGSDVQSARDSLSQLVGAVVEVSGTVQKVVKRDGQCKLVIEPGDVPGFVVFADCLSDAETVTNSKIRKGSLVAVRGKFETFGAAAVCLSDCRLLGNK